MKHLEGKVALITDGNSGIGLATAKEFHAQGAKVPITSRDKTALLKTGSRRTSADVVDP